MMAKGRHGSIPPQMPQMPCSLGSDDCILEEKIAFTAEANFLVHGQPWRISLSGQHQSSRRRHSGDVGRPADPAILPEQYLKSGRMLLPPWPNPCRPAGNRPLSLTAGWCSTRLPARRKFVSLDHRRHTKASSASLSVPLPDALNTAA